MKYRLWRIQRGVAKHSTIIAVILYSESEMRATSEMQFLYGSMSDSYCYTVLVSKIMHHRNYYNNIIYYISLATVFINHDLNIIFMIFHYHSQAQ